MKMYQTWSRDWEGDDATQCIAAHSHEEAVDILIETSARDHLSAWDGVVDHGDAQDLFENRDWLWVFDDERNPLDHVAVYELRMPSEPEYVDYCDRREIKFNVEEVLKRRGVIDPEFVFDDCGDEDAESPSDKRFLRRPTRPAAPSGS